MNAHVRMGDNRSFTLKQAVLLYQEGSRSFATLHEVKHLPDQAPYLCAGQSVTTGFLETLQRLGNEHGSGSFPGACAGKNAGAGCWWSRAQPRLMFFGDGHAEAKKLNGRMYPHPPIVFAIHARELFVRALAEDRRPTADTHLKNAPYWNTDPHGRVCLGSMRVPEEVSVNSLSGWEEAYFASEFTHPSGAVRLTTHPGGFLGLWSSLAGRKRKFPVRFLADSKQTLLEFVETTPRS